MKNVYKYRLFHTADGKTVAVSSYAGKNVRGVAKLNPNDTFNEEFGENLAVLRCANKIAVKRVKRAEQRLADAEKLFAEAEENLRRKKASLVIAKAELADVEKDLTELGHGRAHF